MLCAVTNSSRTPKRKQGTFRMSPVLEATEVFFDLLAAAVGEEAAGLGVFVRAEAGGDVFIPAGEAVALERFPHLARSGGAAGGEECGGDQAVQE
jgi:hypothetical protein